MIRGFRLFKCTQCGHKFKAVDAEFAATCYAMPQPCPECGSIRTRPVSLFGPLASKMYEPIWRWIESEKRDGDKPADAGTGKAVG